MKNYKQQIKEYKEEIEKKYVRIEAENRTVKACQNILSESILSKQSHRTSYFEFLYEQTKFIKKRWWILQGCILMCLWIWLSNYTSDIKDMMRIMGISATIFVVLIVPEIWKNRRNGAIEIEQASYYTLRQICTARMLMFGVVDLVIVMVFLAITYQTTILSLSDLVVNFLLPVNVSCCICFRVLYSRWEKSEYIAVLSCLVWVGHGSSYVPEYISELIAVDMGCIGLDLACSEYDVSICAKDGSGPYDYDMTTRLIELAKKHQLQYAVDIYPFYSSDVSAALRGGNNIKGALIGPGVGASHGMERTHIQAVENTLKLILAYIQ